MATQAGHHAVAGRLSGGRWARRRVDPERGGLLHGPHRTSTAPGPGTVSAADRWLGEGTEDTKRRIPRSELDETTDTATIVDRAARARLLTLDRGHVEITHEVLIRSWPRLRRWLAGMGRQLSGVRI
ncbi:hypothetical protein AABB02_37120 [Streptomyces rimosus]|uniref:nSTAND1 domain-containing NTPase n=1 Tax=Streptomyces rimosus TaxID=1927 RepID=UPI0031D9A0C5